jgi:hypothetical protein
MLPSILRDNFVACLAKEGRLARWLFAKKVCAEAKNILN